MRWTLFNEIIAMSWDTLRGNKLRSALTVLGIVIGITSIVGMTSLIRGFDESFRDLIRGLGPNTIVVAKFSGLSVAGGASFQQLLKRPNITPDDADAIQAQAPSIAVVDVTLGCSGPGGGRQERIYYKNQKTKPLSICGTTERWPYVVSLQVELGRFFNATEVQHRTRVLIAGQTLVNALFPQSDPIGKEVRVGFEQYTIVGVMAKRPSPGGFVPADDFALMPWTTYAKQYGIRTGTAGRGEVRSIQVSAVPREGVSTAVAMAEIEEIMRIRHGLKLQEPNDFDLVTSEAFLKLWDQITQATFLALVVLSSIALMVGGIGVMSIMTITVTERTREIGVRKALEARRVEILWQFLLESVFLTSAGGVLGIILGSAIGWLVHYLTTFPISLPWWSFAIGIGFSAGVGVFFGMVPAIRASRLDPIEALRYE